MVHEAPTPSHFQGALVNGFSHSSCLSHTTCCYQFLSEKVRCIPEKYTLWIACGEDLGRNGANSLSCDRFLQLGMLLGFCVLNHIACAALDGRITLFALTGTTPDISIVLLSLSINLCSMQHMINISLLKVKRELHICI